MNLSPDPQSVALMGLGNALIDQPGIESNRRQATKSNHVIKSPLTPRPSLSIVKMGMHS